MTHAVGMIEMGGTVVGPTVYSVIYRIDGNPGDGDTVPNLGTYPGLDMLIAEATPGFGQLFATANALPIGQDWQTALIRIGSITGPILTGQAGPFFTNVQTSARCGVWSMSTDGFDNGSGQYISHRMGGLIDGNSSLSGVFDADVTLMMTANIFTGEFRVVTCDGASVADYTTLSTSFNTNFSAFSVLEVSHGTGGPYSWSQSYNGVAHWDGAHCATDADFLARYNEFVSA